MKRVILVVDDERELRNLLTLQLQKENFTVVSADSGEQALALLGSGVHADCIISDIKMPGGISGIEFLETVNSQKIKIPLKMLMSGHAFLEPDEIKRLQIDRFLSKPFSVKSLSSYLHERFREIVDIDGAARLHPRLRNEIVISPHKTDQSLKTNNIGLGGVFITSENPFELGTVFSVSIDLNITIEAKLKVKWVRTNIDGEKPVGMGCEFVDIGNVQKDALKDFLEELSSGPSSILELYKEDN